MPLARFLVWLLKELTTKDPGAVDFNLNRWITDLLLRHPVPGTPEVYERLVDVLPKLDDLNGVLKLMSDELRRLEHRKLLSLGWRANDDDGELDRLHQIERALGRALVHVGLKRLISHAKSGEFSEDENMSNYWFLAGERHVDYSPKDALLEWGREDKSRLVDLAAAFLVAPETAIDEVAERDSLPSNQLDLASFFRLIPKDVVAGHQYDKPTYLRLHSSVIWERARAEAELSLYTWKTSG